MLELKLFIMVSMLNFCLYKIVMRCARYSIFKHGILSVNSNAVIAISWGINSWLSFQFGAFGLVVIRFFDRCFKTRSEQIRESKLSVFVISLFCSAVVNS